VKTVKAGCAHEALRNDLIAVIRAKYADMPADEILAVAAVLVGQLMALQDQRRFTAARVVALVEENIMAGNRLAVADLMNNTAGSA
jgi:hypothetical protein